MKSRTIVHTAVLGTFCLGFGVVLASTDILTVDQIKLRQAEDLQASLIQVMPPAIHDNNPVEDAVVLKDAAGRDVTVYRAKKGGKVTGVAYEIMGNGYAGEIRLILGVDDQGRVLGVRATEHHETPGLGDKIDPAKTDWISRFTGLSLGAPPAEMWKVKKDGGQFDQFSGATITPRGVVGAVKGGLDFFAANKSKLLEVN